MYSELIFPFVWILTLNKVIWRVITEAVAEWDHRENAGRNEEQTLQRFLAGKTYVNPSIVPIKIIIFMGNPPVIQARQFLFDFYTQRLLYIHQTKFVPGDAFPYHTENNTIIENAGEKETSEIQNRN